MMYRRNILFLAVALAFAHPAYPAHAATPEPPSAAVPRYLFQLSYDDAESAISKALAEKGAGDMVAASINGRNNNPIFSYDKPINVELRGLQFDKSLNRWSASLLFMNDGNAVSAIPVSGRFDEMMEVPVLKRQVRNGDIISGADIEYRRYPITRTRNDNVTDSKELVGKSPVRTISANRPIRAYEIAGPTLVKKNGLVEMRYSSAGMEITTAGQAMSDGGKGDVIAVRNVNSKKIIRAVVENEHTVNVMSAESNARQASDAPALNTSMKAEPYAAN